MKNQCHLFFFLILLAFPFAETSAQRVFTRADYDDLLGRTVTLATYVTPLGQDDLIVALLGQTGNDQMWDVAALDYDTSATTGTREYIALPAGLPGEDNPNAQGANYAIRAVPITHNQGGDFNINFYAISDTLVRLHGTYALSDNVVSTLFYDPPYVVHPVPWQNGSTWQANPVEPHSYSWIRTTPGFPDITWVSNGVVNGEGTLITPVDTVNAFRSEVTSTITSNGVPITKLTVVSFESECHTVGVMLFKSETVPPTVPSYQASYTTDITDSLSADTVEPPANVPVTLNPYDEASVSQIPDISWCFTQDASAYWLQVADDPGFTNNATLLVDQQGIQATPFVVNGLAAGPIYYWRVRGQNAFGDGPWSTGRSFTISSGGAVANAPGNLSPADGASVSQTPDLSWNALPDANAYWLQVGDNAGFTKRGGATLAVDQQGIQSTNFAVIGLAAGTTYYWRVRGQNASGDGPWTDGRSFTTASGVAVERLGGDVPSDFRLYPSYPNPFNPKTTIKFDIAAPSVVRLAIYDTRGRQVKVLVSEQLTPGRYEYSWDASTHPSGLFIYRLDAGAFSQTGGMMLIK